MTLPRPQPLVTCGRGITPVRHPRQQPGINQPAQSVFVDALDAGRFGGEQAASLREQRDHDVGKVAQDRWHECQTSSI
jgi:hypothetical protein